MIVPDLLMHRKQKRSRQPNLSIHKMDRTESHPFIWENVEDLFICILFVLDLYFARGKVQIFLLAIDQT